MAVRLVSHEEPLPGYRLIDRLGRGGFGEVWKVEAPGGLLKAMKFVFGDLDACDEESRPAEQELKALKRVQQIRHPYILSLERYDILDGQLIITMELADENLWDRFRRYRGQGQPGIPRDELLRYMEETAEALDLMNGHYGIQHLDVKPQNLFVVHQHVKVGDFGLAKLLEGVKATVTGGVTPVYAAPETFEGYVSRFSDQYSLGIVFQELLTGTRPFTGSNTRQLLMQHLNGTPEMSALPVADRAIIGRALAKKPDERWPTCSEMVRGLRLSGLPAPPPTPAPTPTGRRTDDTGPPSEWATRVQVGGSGRLGTDPSVSGSNQTPNPLPRPPAPSGGGAMPPLVTVGPAGTVVPRLVTPGASNAGLQPAITLTRPVVFQTARMNSLGIAPPERTGDGALFPALVVAVGGVGRLVADRFRQIVRDRYGTPDNVPNVRFLAIDTDPDTDDPAAAKDLVVARLNRSVHYLQRDALPAVDGWLPSGILYKLPRTPGAANGVRAFGRLALIDHYRLIAQRVRQEVEAFLTDDPLAKADKTTGLGLRTNRPRVYVVAGLGGGTGSGMFLDLAFLVRHELKSVGYIRPEVCGVFFVPPADKAAPRSAALGNSYAALTELAHFQARRTKYVTTFDKAEAPIQDADPPFARVAVQVLPKGIDLKGRAEAAARAARALFNEALTPAGRVADDLRDIHRNANPTAAPTCQSFGLFRLTWPRPEVLAAATRRFAQRRIERWTTKDAAPVRDQVKAVLDEYWAERKLGYEAVVTGFEAAARAAVREDPEKVFDAVVDPLRTRTPSGSRLDMPAVIGVFEQLLGLVGRPGAEDDAQRGTLHAALIARFHQAAKEAEGQLAMLAVSFIEEPQFRLAGAEEAVRQASDRLKRQVDALEPVAADLEKKARHDFGRLVGVLSNMERGGGGWKGSATAEAFDLLRLYPRSQLRAGIVALTLSVYRKLHGAAPEYLREVSMCRAGLEALHAEIAAAAPDGTTAGPGKLILPDGCATLDDAADRFLSGVNPDDVLGFDHALQKETARKFRGLAGVCLKVAEKGPHFRELLTTRAREFLDARLDAADPAAVFFRNRSGGPADHPLIGEAFDEAEPDLPGGGVRPDEATVLAVPPGANGDRFRAVVADALPNVEFTAAPLPDDITFYREYPRLELAALPQLGGVGREAAAALAADHAPHTRADIPWAPAG